MAAKVLHSYAVSPKTRKSNVLEFLAGLQEKPQHRWIPIEEMQGSTQATLTPRQANWLATQVERRVENAEISFELVPQAEEDES